MLHFIGTLHKHLTPEDELIRIIESYSPRRVLVEITQEDMEQGDVASYPPEMQAILVWARSKNIEAYGMDSAIHTFKAGTSEHDVQNLDIEQRAIIDQHDWKDFNQAALDKILETKTWQKIVDTAKDNERNQEMYDNIVRLTQGLASQPIVVVTGSGHIPFFREKFPDAHFPLG